MIGNAVTVVGFGGQGSDAFKNACKAIGDVASKVSGYPLLSFVHLSEDSTPLRTLDMKTGEWTSDAAQKLVALPSLAFFTANWEKILREISAALEGTLVSLVVNGEIQVALGGNVL